MNTTGGGQIPISLSLSYFLLTRTIWNATPWPDDSIWTVGQHDNLWSTLIELMQRRVLYTANSEWRRRYFIKKSYFFGSTMRKIPPRLTESEKGKSRSVTWCLASHVTSNTHYPHFYTQYPTRELVCRLELDLNHGPRLYIYIRLPGVIAPSVNCQLNAVTTHFVSGFFIIRKLNTWPNHMRTFWRSLLENLKRRNVLVMNFYCYFFTAGVIIIKEEVSEVRHTYTNTHTP